MHAHVAAEQQRADAVRAAELVAGHGQRGGAAAAKSTGTCADRLHRVGVERHAGSAASAASSATGWTVPTSLFAHIAVTSATSVARERLAQRLGVDPAVRRRPAAR